MRFFAQIILHTPETVRGAGYSDEFVIDAADMTDAKRQALEAAVKLHDDHEYIISGIFVDGPGGQTDEVAWTVPADREFNTYCGMLRDANLYAGVTA